MRVSLESAIQSANSRLLSTPESTGISAPRAHPPSFGPEAPAVPCAAPPSHKGEVRMIMSSSKAVQRTLSLAGVIVALAVGTANAGECPADKVAASGQGQQAGATMPKGVTDNVLGVIDLAKEPIAIQDRMFRLRRLEIQ